MDDKKMSEYANNLVLDMRYHFENDEEQNIGKREIQVLEWLVEQAKKVEMYQKTLFHIAQECDPPANYWATETLFDANKRFNKKNSL